MADNTLNVGLQEYMKAELILLERFREAEIELKHCIHSKDWDSLEGGMGRMNALGEELVRVEEARNRAFLDLRDLVGETEHSSFYQVIVHLPVDERETLSELYRSMKFAAVGIQAITYCIDEHVQTINGTMHGILNELFPYRKGNLYSREGKKQEVEDNPMVINHHL